MEAADFCHKAAIDALRHEGLDRVPCVDQRDPLLGILFEHDHMGVLQVRLAPVIGVDLDMVNAVAQAHVSCRDQLAVQPKLSSSRDVHGVDARFRDDQLRGADIVDLLVRQ